MSLDQLYDKTCTLYTVSTTKNRIGELSESLTSVATSVPCRINRKNNTELIFGDNEATRIDARIYLNVTSIFEEWDYIYVDSTYYKVISKYSVSDSTDSHHLECDCYIDKQF